MSKCDAILPHSSLWKVNRKRCMGLIASCLQLSLKGKMTVCYRSKCIYLYADSSSMEYDRGKDFCGWYLIGPTVWDQLR